MSATTTASPSAPDLPADEAVRVFAEAMARGDFDGLARLLSPEVQVRALLPSGLATWSGIPETIDRVESWFGNFITTEAEATTPSLVADCYVASWRLDGAHAGSSRHVIEQHAVIAVGPAGIERIDLVCSGFRRVEKPSTDGTRCWDAGDLGCSDGLPGEFRRQMEAIDAGGHLEVTVRDAAAREDLPPLARMMGHTVEQVDDPGDGRLILTIRRGEPR